MRCITDYSHVPKRKLKAKDIFKYFQPLCLSPSLLRGKDTCLKTPAACEPTLLPRVGSGLTHLTERGSAPRVARLSVGGWHGARWRRRRRRTCGSAPCFYCCNFSLVSLWVQTLQRRGDVPPASPWRRAAASRGRKSCSQQKPRGSAETAVFLFSFVLLLHCQKVTRHLTQSCRYMETNPTHTCSSPLLIFLYHHLHTQWLKGPLCKI